MAGRFEPFPSTAEATDRKTAHLSLVQKPEFQTVDISQSKIEVIAQTQR